MHLTYLKKCRGCGSDALTPVISLGVQYLQGGFLTKDGSGPKHSHRQVPLSLVRCDPMKDQHACGLLQTEHGVPPDLMYQVYWYRSGTNATMREHLRSIVNHALEMQGGKTRAVLDIGCNDGTLLSCYPEHIDRTGVDPSNIIPQSGGGIEYIRDFFPSAEIRARKRGVTFDIITSIAMFYDLDDPKAFVREIRDLLSPHGLWVVEVSYMPTMIQQGSYDSICHEHLSYFSFAVLEEIFAAGGLKVAHAEFNTMNGGSIRCFVTHKDCFEYKSTDAMMRLRDVRIAEFDMGLDTDAPYREFQARIERHREELSQTIRTLHAEGKKIHLYGASTKGNTILQWCGLDSSLIECASDRNPEKRGLITPGSGIEIVSEQESRDRRPDYYLVLPWHFQEEFLEREKAMLERGTGFIFPLPEVRIVRGS
jgi:SAM-dependent methyltransferase